MVSNPFEKEYHSLKFSLYIQFDFFFVRGSLHRIERKSFVLTSLVIFPINLLTRQFIVDPKWDFFDCFFFTMIFFLVIHVVWWLKNSLQTQLWFTHCWVKLNAFLLTIFFKITPNLVLLSTQNRSGVIFFLEKFCFWKLAKSLWHIFVCCFNSENLRKNINSNQWIFDYLVLAC